MAGVILQLPLDRSGKEPNNLISGEEHPLVVTPGFPYKIITLEHGGFYSKSLRVYDEAYNRLVDGRDYIYTYEYKNASQSTGLNICGAIIFLDKLRTGKVYTSAQMVGGDLCYSFTVIEDYVRFFKTQPINYIPFNNDYVGNEPLWKPGELEKERWHLDTYQPFNNEIEGIGYSAMGGGGVYEDDYRKQVIEDYENFIARFNDRLDRHIQDKDNPHVDRKYHMAMGLDLLENYKVATSQEMIAGTSNELYVTPALTAIAITEWATKPLNAHIQDKDNPHRLTAAQIDTQTTTQIDQLAGTKYLRNERVANANYAGPGNATYQQLYNDYRTQIPAGNFAAGGANGYLAQGRYARGVPAANRVLLADSQSWIDFNDLCQLYGSQDASDIYVLSIAPGVTEDQAFGIAMSQPQVWTAKMGSMFVYDIYITRTWGAGNGAITNTHPYTSGCVRTESGWVKI